MGVLEPDPVPAREGVNAAVAAVTEHDDVFSTLTADALVRAVVGVEVFSRVTDPAALSELQPGFAGAPLRRLEVLVVRRVAISSEPRQRVCA